MNLQLDWLTHDGINLPMLNDVPRNNFYDQSIKDIVKNKVCCDIGFGTGLLSLLALRHGAKHVIAYEKNLDRYHFGQQIIEHLGLENRIELIHASFNTEDLDKTKCDVFIHEIIHQGLWGEGVWWIRPKNPGHVYVPGVLFFELWAHEISDSTVDGLFSNDGSDYFNPGVEVDIAFIDFINEFFLGTNSKKIQTDLKIDQLHDCPWDRIHKDWSFNLASVFDQNTAMKLAWYEVDYTNARTTFFDSFGTRTADFEQSQCDLQVDTSPWKQSNLMLRPRFGLRHGKRKLYLDGCRNWGGERPWIFSNPRSNLIFQQNFYGSNFSIKKN